MKLPKLPFLFFLFLLLNSFNSRGSHLIGGEITWECMQNGTYIFNMKVYRDCSGITYTFQNENIQITGNPLPRDVNNQTISQITMFPDWGRYNFLNGGDISPECNSFLNSIDCANNDIGAYQEFTYRSAPMYLQGTPPVGGWHFSFQPACCRSGRISNIDPAGSMHLRAVLYADSSQASSTQCISSSAQFAEVPSYFFCRGVEADLNFWALDSDLDSVSFHLDHPISSSTLSSQPYFSGYSSINPTPDQSFDSLNKPFKINALNGQMSFKVNNGTGIESYTIVVRVDSWKNNMISSSIYREVPLSIFDCLPDTNGLVNKKPSVVNPFQNSSRIVFNDTFQAGSFISFPLLAIDSSVSDQLVTTSFFGSHFSRDYTDSLYCNGSQISPCATLSPSPLFNSNNLAFELMDTNFVSTQFNWQTSCSMLGVNNSPKTYYFYLKTKDDHCPIPQINYQVIAITLENGIGTPCGNITSVTKDILDKEWVDIFPNPTNGLVNVKLAQKEQLEVNIRNLQGKFLESISLKNKSSYQLELDSPSGVYFIEISNTKGEKVFKKVVKQ